VILVGSYFGWAAITSAREYRSYALAIRSVSFSLEDVGWDADDEGVRVDLHVTNHGNEDVILDQLSFGLYLDDRHLAFNPERELERRIAIGERDTLRFEIPIPERFHDTLDELRDSPHGAWSLQGTAIIRRVGRPSFVPRHINLVREVKW